MSTLIHPLAAATRGRQHGSSDIPGVTWPLPTRILATDVSFELERARKKTGIPTTSTAETHWSTRTLPTCDMSLGWLTIAMLEARDFVELLEPYKCQWHCSSEHASDLVCSAGAWERSRDINYPARRWCTSTLRCPWQRIIYGRHIQWALDLTWMWCDVASSKSSRNMWQFALGHCEIGNFPTAPNNSWPKTVIGKCANDFRQHGRRCPEEHGEKLQFVPEMEWSVQIT